MKKRHVALWLSAVCSAPLLSASGCGGSATQLGSVGGGGARASGGASASKGGSPSASGGASTSQGGEAGASNGGADGSTGGTGPLPPCASDKACAAAGQLCDPNREVCVDCRADTDCAKNEQCLASSCKAFVTCINSRDCPTDQVCDETAGRCVQCLSNADCPPATVCATAQCRPACASDKDCVSNNQLCDQAGGYCVDCLKDADCGGSSHCDAGGCVGDVCTPLSASCLGTELFSCDAHGAGYGSTECSGGCSDSPTAHCAGSTGEAGATGSAGAGDTAGAGGESGSPCPANPDVVAVPDCGTPGGPSANAYSGVVTITVSGITNNAPDVPDDPFYALVPGNLTQSMGTCPSCVVYNRASEGSCVCSYECASTSHRLSDLLVGGYPAFNPLHTYTVTVDLGAASPERLNFGYPDCGCGDNSGGYTVTFDCAP